MIRESRVALIGALTAGLCAGTAAAQEPAPPRLEGPSVRVSGRLVAPDRFRLAGGSLVLAPSGATPAADITDVALFPDGTFNFNHVPPGRYEIRARASMAPGGVPHVAVFRLRVEDSPITNVVMPMLPAAGLSGQVVFDAAAPRRPVGVSVRASLVTDGVMPDDEVSTDLQPNGGFVLRGLLAGSYVLRLDGLPEPWALDRVELRGEDITDAGLETAPGRRTENIRVTVTGAATHLSGRVVDADGRGADGAVVLVIPLSEQFWRSQSRRLARVRTDPAGRFSIRGLPAGEYRALAAVELDAGAEARPAALRRLSAAGLPVSLSTSTPVVVDLALTPAPPDGASPR